jgi:hypothetical protein
VDATQLIELKNGLQARLALEGPAVKELEDLLEVLNTMEVHDVKGVVELHRNDQQFNVLGDLFQPDQRRLLQNIVHVLLKDLKQVTATPNNNQIANSSVASTTPSKLASAAPVSTTTTPASSADYYHLWGKDAQLLVLPLGDKLHYYCYVDMKDDEDSNKKGEHVIFCLDISASMNHDEKGMYCPPKSPDHPASSIKKARELIPALAMAAIKRQASVSIVVWNHKVNPSIEFTPAMFLQPDSQELVDDKQMDTLVRYHASFLLVMQFFHSDVL